MNRRILRGDLYYAHLDRGIGSEQNGCRPVLVIQNNMGNRFSPTVIVVAITGKVAKKKLLPTHYILDGFNQLEQQSLVLAEQIATIDKNRLDRYIGNVGAIEMNNINKILAISIGI